MRPRFVVPALLAFLVATGACQANASAESAPDAAAEGTQPRQASLEADPLGFAAFDAHAQAAATEITAYIRAATDAAERNDLTEIRRTADELGSVTGDELDWLRGVERSGAISEGSCYFEMASAYALGIYYFDVAASEAVHYADTGDLYYATSAADYMTQGSDAIGRAQQLRASSATNCE